VIVADTSVLVAAFSSWHRHHLDAERALDGAEAVVSHTALECFSVLTRLPTPFRMDPASVVTWIERQFGDRWLVLPQEEHAHLPGWLARSGIAGGAVYDALIARTADFAGATLISLDRRASDNYRRCGVEVELL
jgi:predicted nucleic acid-binding protein